MSGPGRPPLPPLKPGSPEDIATFSALDLALRSHPELAREGVNVLNAKALSKLVDGIRSFQDKHLGKQSKSQYWPLLRIPDDIFRDRSRSGPLFTALLSAYRQKASASWRSFDFTSPKRFDDNIALLRRMEKDLTSAGFLKRPIIYFDATVPKARKGGLVTIAEKFGATVVTDHTKATHVVAGDPEFDTEEDILKEERKQREGEDVEKLYLRTLAIVDPNKEINTGEGGERKKGGKGGLSSHPMALVHWWFWPSSFDEWMPASDVSGDVEQEPPPRPPGGPWCVGCKFVRDVAIFNEWGVEVDYAVDDYKKKVALYKNSATKEESKTKKGSRSTTSGKKGSKTDDSSKSESGSKKSAPSSQKPVASSSSTSKGSTSTGGSSKRDRRAGSGMNPRQINTGYYGSRGERIRRTVYDGALRVPPYASAVVHDALAEFTGCKKKLQQTYELPAVGGIIRPSQDLSLGPTISVTELSSFSVGASTITQAQNRMVPINPKVDEPLRIRGGGEDDGKVEEHSKQYAPSALTAGNTGTSQNEGTASITATAPLSQAASLQQPHGGMGNLGSLTAALEQEAGTNVHTVVAAPPPGTQQQGDSGQSPQTTNILPEGTNIGQSSSSSAPKHTPATVVTGQSHPEAGVVPGVTNTVSTSGVIQTGPNIAATSSVMPVTSQKPQTTSIPQVGSALSKSPHTAGTVGTQRTVLATANPPAPNSTPAALAKPPPGQPGRSVGKVLNFAAAPSNVASTPNANQALQASKLNPTVANNSNTSGSTQPSAVGSSSIRTQPGSAVTPPKMLALPKNPVQQVPLTANSAAGSAGAAIHGEQATSADQDTTVTTPSWYSSKNSSDYERNMLPEWFNGSAPHRTPESYVKSREQIISVARQSPNRFVTGTAVRRCIPGDAGSLLRLHKFLVTWGFINGSSINESAPTSVGLRKEAKNRLSSSRGASSQQKFWTKDRSEALAKEVVRQANKRRKVTDDTNNQVNIDWDIVASAIGDGVTALECQHTFLGLALEDDNNEEKKDASHAETEWCLPPTSGWRKDDIFRDLLAAVRPEVAKAALDAAMAATDDVLEAQKASLFGVIAGQAKEQARFEEDAISRLLMEVVDQRMSKLENRIALLDDVEGMLEAERVALELERRDLYTARCRYWLSD